MWRIAVCARMLYCCPHFLAVFASFPVYFQSLCLCFVLCVSFFFSQSVLTLSFCLCGLFFGFFLSWGLFLLFLLVEGLFLFPLLFLFCLLLRMTILLLRRPSFASFLSFLYPRSSC